MIKSIYNIYIHIVKNTLFFIVFIVAFLGTININNNSGNNSMFLFAQSALEQKYKLAETYEKGGNFEAAIRLYEEIYKESKQEKYFISLTRVYKSQNRFQELKYMLEEQLKINSSADLLILYGEVNWQLGNTSLANSSWNQVLSICNSSNSSSDFSNIYTNLITTLNALRLFEKSIPVLKEAKNKFPENLSFPDGLARLYTITGNYSDGLEETIYLLNKTGDLQLAQGKIFALMNSNEAAEYLNKTFQKKIKQDDNILILKLYGWYLRTNKNFNKALEIFSELDKRQANKGQQLYIFAEESRRDGEYDVALQAFQKIINMDKSSQYLNSALFLYAKTMEEKLQNDSSLSRTEAIKIINNYKNIIIKYPKTQYSEESKLRVAHLQESTLNEPIDAISTLQDVIKINFNSFYSIQAMYALSNIYIHMDSLEACEKILTTIINTYGKQTANPNIESEVNKSKFLKAEVYFYKNIIDSALIIYEQLAKNTNSDIASNALEKVSLINQNKDFSKALRILANAELMLKQKNIKTAISLYQELAILMPNEQISEKATIKYAELEIQQGNLTPALEFLNKYLETNMYPLYGDNALFLLGNISEKQKDTQVAISHYTNLLSRYPRSIFIIETRKRIKYLRDNI